MKKPRIGSQRFFDRWAPQYDAALNSYQYSVPEKIFDAVWPSLAQHGLKVMRLLDLGIGTGQCSRPFQATGRFHITGVDISKEMLEHARAQGVADEFVQLNLDRDDLPFEDQAFDIIIAGGVMEFISDPGELALEIARVLRPGGLVALTFETLDNRRHYRSGMLSGELAAGEDYAILQRFAVPRGRPTFYKKYLYGERLMEDFLLRDGLETRQRQRFVAYRWPGGTDISYELIVAQKGDELSQYPSFIEGLRGK